MSERAVLVLEPGTEIIDGLLTDCARRGQFKNLIERRMICCTDRTRLAETAIILYPEPAQQRQRAAFVRRVLNRDLVVYLLVGEGAIENLKRAIGAPRIQSTETDRTIRDGFGGNCAGRGGRGVSVFSAPPPSKNPTNSTRGGPPGPPPFFMQG